MSNIRAIKGMPEALLKSIKQKNSITVKLSHQQHCGPIRWPSAFVPSNLYFRTLLSTMRRMMRHLWSEMFGNIFLRSSFYCSTFEVLPIDILTSPLSFSNITKRHHETIIQILVGFIYTALFSLSFSISSSFTIQSSKLILWSICNKNGK